MNSNLKILNCETTRIAKRAFSSAFKSGVAIEAIKSIKTVSELAQEYELHPAQITQWKKQFFGAKRFSIRGRQKEE
ncbi:MAG: hypothetical protein EP346_03905 [Bacteroidetes bacterium]|nr:MAG: hypothetical protein EP346_03905 [Bacteroidota bacterium]